MTPVTNNFSTAVKPSTTKPEKPVTPIPVTNTVIIEPIKIPSNSLIAGDGGCAKTNRTCSAVTNKPPVIAGPCLPEPIESVPLEPIPLKPIPVDVIQPIIVEEIQLTEVELPETGVVAWGLALYYILTLVIIGGGYVAWKKYQKRKLTAKPATKRKPRKRAGRKKR